MTYIPTCYVEVHPKRLEWEDPENHMATGYGSKMRDSHPQFVARKNMENHCGPPSNKLL